MTCPKCGRRDVPKRPDKTRSCRRCGPLQTFRFPSFAATSSEQRL